MIYISSGTFHLRGRGNYDIETIFVILGASWIDAPAFVDRFI